MRAQARGCGPCIAFVRRPAGARSEVCLTDPAGRDVLKLSSSLGDCDAWGPAWSPDGRLVCQVALPDGRSRLALTPVDGSPSRLLAAPREADDDSPAWSPDGARIAFSRGNHDGTDHLYLYSLVSDTAWRLTRGVSLDGQPSWSPDGRWVVFRRALAAPAGLHVLAVEGGAARFLTPGQDPAWHPAGSLIAYSHGGLLWAIKVREGAEADGPPQPLTRDPRAEDHHPSWSPDGGRIVFTRRWLWEPAGALRLMVLDVAAGEESQIGEGEEPDWGPARRCLLRSHQPRRLDAASKPHKSGHDPASAGTTVAYHKGGRQRWAGLHALRWW